MTETRAITPQRNWDIPTCQAYLRRNMRQRNPVPCPVCRRKVIVARRRINSAMAEVFVALGTRGGQLLPADRRAWVHIERQIIDEGLAMCRGRDWGQLFHWNLIESRTHSRNPRGKDVGLWRLTDFGVWVVTHPRRELLPEWVDTWNGRRWGHAEKRIALVASLGRPFDFEAEIRRAA